jgi:hypothetical protein
MLLAAALMVAAAVTETWFMVLDNLEIVVQVAQVVAVLLPLAFKI